MHACMAHPISRIDIPRGTQVPRNGFVMVWWPTQSRVLIYHDPSTIFFPPHRRSSYANADCELGKRH